MSEATAVEMLEAEHRVIQKMVASMSVLAEQIEDGEPVDVSLLESIVVFLRTFADRLHHGKEESFLFPALIRRGVPSQGCPIGGLTMEHQKGRVMVGELADAIRGYAAGEPPARENLVKSLRVLVAFYPSHIWKEDYLLFPLAGKVLTPEDQQQLMEKFETVERELGLDVHEGFSKLATELERKVSGIVSSPKEG
ncbi:MAG TPA: hemerythrin domain-containing protein [Candidatus Dormibacteraeota bacterium]|nr:hemerythrin domain-containing protein [Candidatus Dormibacteraeota bacterium]